MFRKGNDNLFFNDHNVFPCRCIPNYGLCITWSYHKLKIISNSYPGNSALFVALKIFLNFSLIEVIETYSRTVTSYNEVVIVWTTTNVIGHTSNVRVKTVNSFLFPEVKNLNHGLVVACKGVSFIMAHTGYVISNRIVGFFKYHRFIFSVMIIEESVPTYSNHPITWFVQEYISNGSSMVTCKFSYYFPFIRIVLLDSPFIELVVNVTWFITDWYSIPRGLDFNDFFSDFTV